MTKAQKNHEVVPQSKAHKSYVFQERRVFGYELDTDLQEHYDFLEYVYLLATGTFPSAEQKKGLDLILRNLTLCKANDSALHAARASRCSGGQEHATILTAIATNDPIQNFDPILREKLQALGFTAQSIDDAFFQIGISPAFAKTLVVLLSSLGTLSEAFRGEANFAEFPASLPLYEYDND